MAVTKSPSKSVTQKPKAKVSTKPKRQGKAEKVRSLDADDEEEEQSEHEKRKIVTLRAIGDWRSMVERASRQKKDFYYTATNSSVVIRQDRCRYVFSQTTDFYSIRSFNLFQKVRREVLSNIKEKKIDVPYIRSTDVDYYGYASEFHNVKTEKAYDDIWELDINMAYYNAAHSLGYISKEFYDECRSLDKKMRLRLIGSIAILKTKFIYKHGRLDDVQIVNNPVLRSAWFHICRYVSDAMRDMAKILGKDFMFFWVDGIVFRGKHHHQTIHDFAYLKYGFDFKLLPMDGLIVKKTETGVVKVEVKGEKDKRESRNFFLDTKKQERALAMMEEMNKLIPRGKIKKKDLQFVK